MTGIEIGIAILGGITGFALFYGVKWVIRKIISRKQG